MRALALAVAVLVAAQAAPAAQRFDWRRLHRPVRIPRLSADGSCPVSPSRASPSNSGRPIDGAGPAFLAAVGNAAGGVIDTRQSLVDAHGWFGQKTPWLVRHPYNGPVLVRGARIGGHGQVRFAKGYGQHLVEVRYAAGEVNASDRTFRMFASATLVRAGGCYAFQLDGTSFSTVIVVRVVR